MARMINHGAVALAAIAAFSEAEAGVLRRAVEPIGRPNHLGLALDARATERGSA